MRGVAAIVVAVLLSITFIGKSVGKRVATAMLNASSGLSIWGCSGSAVISRADKEFRITPLADSFTATCRIAAAGSDRLELLGTHDVLAIESTVADVPASTPSPSC